MPFSSEATGGATAGPSVGFFGFGLIDILPLLIGQPEPLYDTLIGILTLGHGRLQDLLGGLLDQTEPVAEGDGQRLWVCAELERALAAGEGH